MPRSATGFWNNSQKHTKWQAMVRIEQRICKISLYFIYIVHCTCLSLPCTNEIWHNVTWIPSSSHLHCLVHVNQWSCQWSFGFFFPSLTSYIVMFKVTFNPFPHECINILHIKHCFTECRNLGEAVAKKHWWGACWCNLYCY